MRVPLTFAFRPSFLLAAAVALQAGCGGDPETTSAASNTAGSSGASGSSAASGASGSGGSGASGGAAGAGGDGGTAGAAGGGFVMAPHTPFPELEGSPGAVIPHGKLISITWKDNPDSAKIGQAGDVLVASQWLLETGKDYGVGAGEHLAKVVLPEVAPASLTESELFTLIDTHIKDGLIPKPAADTMYMIYISKQTSFKDIDGYELCSDYLGYHYQEQIPSGLLTYGIVGDCGMGFVEVTATFAHEYIEMATDADVNTGYVLDVANNDPWIALQYLENADLCDYSDYTVEGGFSFQKSWSNSAAKAAASSPCAPVNPEEVYFNVSADPATVPLVKAGQAATFTLTGWSTAPTKGDWELHYDTAYYGEFDPQVDFSDTMINNGKTVTVTLTVPKGTQSGLIGTAMVYSGPDYSRYWPVTVRVQ